MLVDFALPCFVLFFFFFNDTATTEIYTLSLHDALPILADGQVLPEADSFIEQVDRRIIRSEEHTSELQSPPDLVCRLLLEKKKNNIRSTHSVRVALCRLGCDESLCLS